MQTTPNKTKRTTILAAAMASLLATLASTPAADAALVISAPILSAGPGATGTFDVLIHNDDTAGSIDVAAFDLDFSVTGSDVTFTDVDIITTTSYLFADSSLNYTSDPFSFSTFPGSNFIASDAEFDFSGVRAVGAGETYALARVHYAVDAGATGGTRLLLIDAATSFSNGTGDLLSFDPGNGGSITVVVPEPATALAAIAGMGVVARRRRA